MGKKASLTAELRSIDSAACLRCWPMGDNGVFEDKEFNVGTAFVVNLRGTFARSDAVELGACDCKRTPIGRSGGGTKGSSRGERSEFENVMVIFLQACMGSQHPSANDGHGGLWGFVGRTLRRASRGRKELGSLSTGGRGHETRKTYRLDLAKGQSPSVGGGDDFGSRFRGVQARPVPPSAGKEVVRFGWSAALKSKGNNVTRKQETRVQSRYYTKHAAVEVFYRGIAKSWRGSKTVEATRSNAD